MDEREASVLPVGVVRLTDAGTIAYTNEWFAQWAGVSADALIGRSIGDLLVYARDDLLAPDAGPGPWVMLNPHKAGRAVMVTRHRQEHGGEVVVVSEASERFHALTELRRRYALADRTRTRLQLVMDSAVALAAATTEDRLAEILSDTTARAYRADESTVYLRQEGGPSRIAAGHDALIGRFDIEHLISIATSPRRVVKVVGPEAGERLHRGLGTAMREAGVQALIAAPLHHEEIDFGAFVSWFQHERTFDSEATPLAEALAGQAAQALATLRLQSRLAHAATHDEVTGLPNRRLLESELEQLVGVTGCAAVFIDLDGFKAVNDRLGHQAGDRMLRDVADRLLTGVRTGDLVARYGGDEFVVVAREIDEPDVGIEVAQRVLDLLHGGADRSRLHARLSASIGVAIAEPGSGLLAEQLIRRADVAMYRAKSAGGDRVVLAE